MINKNKELDNYNYYLSVHYNMIKIGEYIGTYKNE